MSMKFASYLAASTGLIFLSGCSVINKTFDNKESVNYTTAKTVSSLEVPPDLTAPQYDSTFAVNSGIVSASSINKPNAVGSTPVIENILTGSTIKRTTASESKPKPRSVESEVDTERTGRNIDSDGYGVGRRAIKRPPKSKGVKGVRGAADKAYELERTGRNIDSDGYGYGVGSSKAANSSENKAIVSPSINNGPPGLKVNDGFDSVWTRTGIALTGMGFSVDGQDRTKGLYAVKWVGYTKEGKSVTEQLQQMMSFKKEILEEGTKQIIQVRNTSGASTKSVAIQVFNKNGKATQPDIAKKILDRLRKELNR